MDPRAIAPSFDRFPSMNAPAPAPVASTHCRQRAHVSVWRNSPSVASTGTIFELDEIETFRKSTPRRDEPLYISIKMHRNDVISDLILLLNVIYTGVGVGGGDSSSTPASASSISAENRKEGFDNQTTRVEGSNGLWGGDVTAIRGRTIPRRQQQSGAASAPTDGFSRPRRRAPPPPPLRPPTRWPHSARAAADDDNDGEARTTARSPPPRRVRGASLPAGMPGGGGIAKRGVAAWRGQGRRFRWSTLPPPPLVDSSIIPPLRPSESITPPFAPADLHRPPPTSCRPRPPPPTRPPIVPPRRTTGRENPFRLSGRKPPPVVIVVVASSAPQSLSRHPPPFPPATFHRCLPPSSFDCRIPRYDFRRPFILRIHPPNFSYSLRQHPHSARPCSCALLPKRETFVRLLVPKNPPTPVPQG